jgi:hypothetical protein
MSRKNNEHPDIRLGNSDSTAARTDSKGTTMALSESLRQQISELMPQNTQKCLAIVKKVTQKLIESHLVEDSVMRCEEIHRRLEHG